MDSITQDSFVNIFETCFFDVKLEIWTKNWFHPAKVLFFEPKVLYRAKIEGFKKGCVVLGKRVVLGF